MERFWHFAAEAVDFFKGIGARKIWTFAAASTFYLFLTLVPFFGLLCSLLPFTPLTEEYLLDILRRVAPDELYALLSTVIQGIYESDATTLSISAVASVWSASLSMQSLMRGMDSVYDLTRRENFILFRLRACFFMVITLAAVLSTLCAIVYGGMIVDLLERHVESTWAEKLLLGTVRSARFPVMIIVLFVVFLLFYRWMPAGRRRLLSQWPGAAFSTAAWMLFSMVFSLYVEYSGKYGVYGALGTLIVASLWVYYCLFILLVGGYINWYVAERREKRRAD